MGAISKELRTASSRPVDVIYLIGCGRSGSTILDAALGVHPEIVSLGEVDRLESVGWLGTKNCACGRDSSACDFWSSVQEEWACRAGSDWPEFSEARRVVQRRRSLTKAILAPASLGRSPAFLTYARGLAGLFESLAQVSGRSILVDSSKRPSRGLFLSLIPGLRVTYVHVLRDVRGYIWSRKKAGVRVVRSFPHWYWTNLLTEWVAWSQARTVLGRHERFVADPLAVLGRVADAVHITPEPFQNHFRTPRPVPFGHMIGGNRIRHKGPVMIKGDRGWEDGLGSLTQWVAGGLAAPLHRRYAGQRFCQSGTLKKIPLASSSSGEDASVVREPSV